MVFADYSVGDQGEGVVQLQSDLARVGFIIDADGIFGPQTKLTVKMFQAARGQTDTGVADAATLADLASAISEGWTTPSPTITVSEDAPVVRVPRIAPASAPASAAAPAAARASSSVSGMLPLAAAGAIAAVLFFGKGSKRRR